MSTGSNGSDAKGELILVVEDDRSLREGLATNLRLQGYEVATAGDGESGMRLAFDSRPALIILDIMLPGWSGLEILKELRKRRENVPVLVLSARRTTDERVEGLDLGADDYMVKPFDLPELIARVRAMLRRKRTHDEGRSLSFGDVTIDVAGRSVGIAGKPIDMSPKEFDLLCLFASAPGHVFSREAILERVWGWDYEGTARTVDNVVASLRKKLGGNRHRPRYIRTVPRVGYKLLVP